MISKLSLHKTCLFFYLQHHITLLLELIYHIFYIAEFSVSKIKQRLFDLTNVVLFSAFPENNFKIL